MLASTSSKTRRGVASFVARMVLSASITRAISPEEAIKFRGRQSCPGLAEKRNWTVELPVSVKVFVGSIWMVNAGCLKPSLWRCWVMVLESVLLVLVRLAVISLATWVSSFSK